MTEQQYTCPFCHKDYTRFTIHEHYGCGVEPLETIEEIEQELDAISEEVVLQEMVELKIIGELEVNPISPAIIPAEPTETEPNAEVTQPEQLPQEESPKVEPKKRGRKPKAK